MKKNKFKKSKNIKAEKLKIKLKSIDAVFSGQQFYIKFYPLNDFFVRRASYHLKASECKNVRAFEFFQLLNKNMFNGTLKNRFLILAGDTRLINCLIVLINSDNLVIC